MVLVKNGYHSFQVDPFRYYRKWLEKGIQWMSLKVNIMLNQLNPGDYGWNPLYIEPWGTFITQPWSDVESRPQSPASTKNKAIFSNCISFSKVWDLNEIKIPNDQGIIFRQFFRENPSSRTLVCGLRVRSGLWEHISKQTVILGLLSLVTELPYYLKHFDSQVFEMPGKYLIAIKLSG